MSLAQMLLDTHPWHPFYVEYAKELIAFFGLLTILSAVATTKDAECTFNESISYIVASITTVIGVYTYVSEIPHSNAHDAQFLIFLWCIMLVPLNIYREIMNAMLVASWLDGTYRFCPSNELQISVNNDPKLYIGTSLPQCFGSRKELEAAICNGELK